MDVAKKESLFRKLSGIKSLPVLGMVAPSSCKVPSAVDLDGFKESQRLAYECVTEAAKVLKVGMTEKEIATWMDNYLNDHGVRGGFHRPLAWFGERTRFKNVNKESHAFPTDTKLASATEAVIFDIAPVLGGYVSDIGFAFSLEENPQIVAAREFLKELRVDILESFSSEKQVADIWAELDKKIVDNGYQNCHKKYIMSVLGHRVYKIPFTWPLNYAGMYSLKAYWQLTSRGLFPELLSPYHTGSKVGVWAVEPHIGDRDHNFGVKFEEIIVVEEGRAYYLQDDVPHIKLPSWVH